MWEDIRMTGKNKEGYPDPTASKAIRAADHMPEHTYRDYCILRAMAYRMGLKITRIKDLGSGKEWSR
jgi:hypothetical protein